MYDVFPLTFFFYVLGWWVDEGKREIREKINITRGKEKKESFK